MLKKFFSIIFLITILATESHAADKWIRIGAQQFYNLTQTHKEKNEIIQTEIGVKGNKGESTINMKINCKTKKVNYGPVDMYSPDGTFLSTVSSDWSGWQAGKGYDWDYLNKICIALKVKKL